MPDVVLPVHEAATLPWVFSRMPRGSGNDRSRGDSAEIASGRGSSKVTRSSTVAVICKQPIAGRVKTRLTPPLSPGRAAAVAQAALRDTLATVATVECDRRVAVLDGQPGAWLPSGFDVLVQRGQGLDERLGAAFADLGPGPTLLIGMDTPQVTRQLLERALVCLQAGETVIGPTSDGGYWAIGLTGGGPEHFRGVPMSTARTFACQRDRLERRGLRPVVMQTLTDVDDIASALAVAAIAPRTRFTQAMAECRALELV